MLRRLPVLGNKTNYFFAPRIASFAALATRNLTTVLAGILILSRVVGLKPERAFLFCFASFPKTGKTNSPFFLALCTRGCRAYRGIHQQFFCWSRWQQRVQFEVQFWTFLAVVYGSGTAALQENRSFSFSTSTVVKIGLKMDCSFFLP
jgi:hypothetical protein